MPNWRVLTQAERLADLADTIGGAFASELAAVLRDLERTLRALIDDLELSGSRTVTVLAVRALALRNELRQLLDEAGYARLARTATSVALDRLVDVVEGSRLARDLAAFVDIDYTRIKALQELARLNLVAQGDEMAIALWRSLKDGLYSGRSRQDILADLATTLDDEQATVRTLYDTTTSVFGRQVEVLKANDAPSTLFAYLGPADGVMRPFCRAHIGKVYTRAEIDALDNGQLPNVLLTAGGYNCRHSWVELADDSDWARLHETGERIPEVAAELRDLPTKARAA